MYLKISDQVAHSVVAVAAAAASVSVLAAYSSPVPSELEPSAQEEGVTSEYQTDSSSQFAAQRGA